MSTKPAPGSSLEAAGKQYSQASTNTLRKLNSIDKKFENISHRVEDVVATSAQYKASEGVLPLLKAKNELAQIVGDLEKLQFNEIDAVETSELSTGKAAARSQRKSLNSQVENLMRRTQNLHNDFVSTVKKIEAAQLTLKAPAAASAVTDEAAAARGEEMSSPTANDLQKKNKKGKKGIASPKAAAAAPETPQADRAAASGAESPAVGKKRRSYNKRKNIVAGEANPEAAALERVKAAVEAATVTTGRKLNAEKERGDGVSDEAVPAAAVKIVVENGPETKRRKKNSAKKNEEATGISAGVLEDRTSFEPEAAGAATPSGKKKKNKKKGKKNGEAVDTAPAATDEVVQPAAADAAAPPSIKKKNNKNKERKTAVDANARAIDAPAALVSAEPISSEVKMKGKKEKKNMSAAAPAAVETPALTPPAPPADATPTSKKTKKFSVLA